MLSSRRNYFFWQSWGISTQSSIASKQVFYLHFSIFLSHYCNLIWISEKRSWSCLSYEIKCSVYFGGFLERWISVKGLAIIERVRRFIVVIESLQKLVWGRSEYYPVIEITHWRVQSQIRKNGTWQLCSTSNNLSMKTPSYYLNLYSNKLIGVKWDYY